MHFFSKNYLIYIVGFILFTIEKIVEEEKIDQISVN